MSVVLGRLSVVPQATWSVGTTQSSESKTGTFPPKTSSKILTLPESSSCCSQPTRSANGPAETLTIWPCFSLGWSRTTPSASAAARSGLHQSVRHRLRGSRLGQEPVDPVGPINASPTIARRVQDNKEVVWKQRCRNGLEFPCMATAFQKAGQKHSVILIRKLPLGQCFAVRLGMDHKPPFLRVTRQTRKIFEGNLPACGTHFHPPILPCVH